jgi:hypothetical protein
MIPKSGYRFSDKIMLQQESIAMRIRTRKLIGTVALLALVTAWALIAMAVAQFAFRSTNELVAWIYYAVAGLGWVLPAMPLISWMSRPDGER